MVLKVFLRPSSVQKIEPFDHKDTVLSPSKLSRSKLLGKNLDGFQICTINFWAHKTSDECQVWMSAENLHEGCKGFRLIIG